MATHDHQQTPKAWSDAETLREAGPHEMFRLIREQKPPTPSQRLRWTTHRSVWWRPTATANPARCGDDSEAIWIRRGAHLVLLLKDVRKIVMGSN